MKLIDKDALVADIKRRKDICKKVVWDLRTQKNKDYYQGKVEAYSEMAELIDTLEAKEVELKQSYIEYINNTYSEEFAKNILDNNIKGDLDNSDLFGIMSYGFELGLKVAQKGE